jgi:hypothetical protein
MNYLLDENVDQAYAPQLRRREQHLKVLVVGEPGAPPKGTLDPEILIWCEEHECILLTNNRKSMPVHLADHIAQGNPVPGIFILNPTMSLGETIEELMLIAGASQSGEYQDTIIFLPYREAISGNAGIILAEDYQPFSSSQPPFARNSLAG